MFKNFTITHSKGIYKFIIPTEIPFYDKFLEFIGLKELSTEVSDYIDKITIDSKYFINSIKKASQYAMTDKSVIITKEVEKYKNVLIDNDTNEGLSIVATNCHILYKSKSNILF